jgi:hypothetical protein
MQTRPLVLLTAATLAVLTGCVVVPGNGTSSSRYSSTGASTYGGNTSGEYQRGYDAGLNGSAYDQYHHPQDYKDGFRAGENARSGASAGVGTPVGGGTSIEYKRGYNDALKGNAFDQDRHPQDYKDGFRAGENAR